MGLTRDSKCSSLSKRNKTDDISLQENRTIIVYVYVCSFGDGTITYFKSCFQNHNTCQSISWTHHIHRSTRYHNQKISLTLYRNKSIKNRSKRSRILWAHLGSSRGGGHKLWIIDFMRSFMSVWNNPGPLGKVSYIQTISTTICEGTGSIVLNNLTLFSILDYETQERNQGPLSSLVRSEHAKKEQGRLYIPLLSLMLVQS